ncbi:Glutathione S-transferase alpha-4, putative [Gryllus bimaculatus]|nr:Glutathione S-transferase alpha-4, putative [Gryllus bimaculatus]
MAPQYKFTYFDFRALGEFIRFLFKYGDIDFEDNRLDPNEWPKLKPSFVKVIWEVDDASKPEEKEKFLKETVPLFLPRLEAQVKTNGGYFVGGKLSWADIYLAAYHETFNHFFKDMFSPYPALQGVIDKVHAIPSIKAYVSKRPKTDI